MSCDDKIKRIAEELMGWSWINITSPVDSQSVLAWGCGGIFKSAYFNPYADDSDCMMVWDMFCSTYGWASLHYEPTTKLWDADCGDVMFGVVDSDRKTAMMDLIIKVLDNK